jgi:hypothetical protein
MHIHMKETKTWTPQEKNKEATEKSCILKQTCSSVNDNNAVALKYFDLRTSAVWRFRK